MVRECQHKCTNPELSWIFSQRVATKKFDYPIGQYHEEQVIVAKPLPPDKGSYCSECAAYIKEPVSKGEIVLTTARYKEVSEWKTQVKCFCCGTLCRGKGKTEISKRQKKKYSTIENGKVVKTEVKPYVEPISEDNKTNKELGLPRIRVEYPVLKGSKKSKRATSDKKQREIEKRAISKKIELISTLDGQEESVFDNVPEEIN